MELFHSAQKMCNHQFVEMDTALVCLSLVDFKVRMCARERVVVEKEEQTDH